MILKRGNVARIDPPSLCEETVGSMLRDLELEVQTQFGRIIFPEAAWTPHAPFFNSLVNYLLNLTGEISSAPVIKEKRIEIGDLVAIKWQPHIGRMGVVESTEGRNYRVYPFPLTKMETVSIIPESLVPIVKANYSGDTIRLGTRVTFPQVNILRSGNGKKGRYIGNQVIFNSLSMYEFYYGGTMVLGYRKKEGTYAPIIPTSRFIFCVPEKMRKAESTDYAEITDTMVAACLKGTGIEEFVSQSLELNRISKNYCSPFLNKEEIELGSFLIAYIQEYSKKETIKKR